MTALLQVSALSHPHLGPLDLSLGRGECVGLAGPSGAGKSLLLRALADLDPSSGRVQLDGRDRREMSGPEWRRAVGYLPAEPGWWAPLARDHFPDPAGTRPLLERLGLEAPVMECAPARLSTGERQRLALVRALLVEPAVLLLDEPTAALDAEAARAVEDLLAERRRAGTGVLWVSHDAAQRERVSDRLLHVVPGGRLVEARA